MIVIFLEVDISMFLVFTITIVYMRENHHFFLSFDQSYHMIKRNIYL